MAGVVVGWAAAEKPPGSVSPWKGGDVVKPGFSVEGDRRWPVRAAWNGVCCARVVLRGRVVPVRGTVGDVLGRFGVAGRG